MKEIAKKNSDQQLGGDQLLFYLNALYEFANEISRQRDTEEILKTILRIVIGTFGITKGIVLTKYVGNLKLEILDHRNLDSQTIQKLNAKLLDNGIQDDLSTKNGLSFISANSDLNSIQSSLSRLLIDVGIESVITFQIKDKLSVFIGLGPLLLGHDFSEPQLKLIKALITHTEIAIGNAMFYQDILEENKKLKEALKKQYSFGDMIGQSTKMRELYQRVDHIAKYQNYSVLITGESGTGKELIARAIHYNGPRKDKIFLPVNCTALPNELVDSELFGYEKGAFTGASSSKPGLFESANGGTIFLDEIAEIPTATQAKLLRVLEQKEIMRIGSNKIQTIDVRVLAATNKDMAKAISGGQFREDLFYRFDVHIQAPPLRERKDDIPLLAKFFLEEIAKENQQSIRSISPEAMKILMDHEWSGNVRELQKLIKQAVMIAKDNIIQPEEISLQVDDSHTVIQEGLSLDESLERFKLSIIMKALKDCNGNITKSAERLGISRQNLQNMMRRTKINKKNNA
jgi:transcriptional regulator with GAF, ATPase, and Fis domain